MTDNGPGYVSKRFNRRGVSRHQAVAKIRHDLRPASTRLNETTNAKPNVFIRTSQGAPGLRHHLPDGARSRSTYSRLYEYFLELKPLQSSVLRSSLSPTDPRRRLSHHTADRSALEASEFVNCVRYPREHPRVQLDRIRCSLNVDGASWRSPSASGPPGSTREASFDRSSRHEQTHGTASRDFCR